MRTPPPASASFAFAKILLAVAYLSFSIDPALRVERQLVGDRGQLLRRCDHRLCVRLELDADGWVTRLRQFFGVDDVDVPFDEHLGELALVVLRVSAAQRTNP